MNQFKQELDIVEVDNNSAQELGRSAIEPSLFEKWKLKRLTRVAASVGALGLAFAASGVSAESSVFLTPQIDRASPGSQFAGYNTNKIWVPNLQAAEQEAEFVASHGADAVRIQEPYTQGGAEVKNDTERLCNAAIVAEKNNLRLIIAMVGHYRDGRLGFMPSSASQKYRFTTAVTSMMWTLAGDEHGCVADQKNLTIGLFNEPDNKKFNQHQFINGRWVAPEREVGLLSYAYPRLKAEASKPGLGVNLTIIGGELSSPSPEHDNVGFIKKMGQIIKDRKINGPIMDIFALHQYANSFNTSPSAPNNSFNPSSVEAIRSYIDPNMPVIYDELGANSDTPNSRESQYSVRLPASIKPFSGEAQANFYRRFIDSAGCNGIEGVMIFHASDDSGDALRTGVASPYYNGKPSERIVAQSFENFSSDNIVCP